MSIADKQSFLKEIERSAGNILTVDQSVAVLKIIAEKLDGYELESIPNGGFNADIDLLKIYLEAKQIEGRSEKTIERYRYVITRALGKIRVPIHLMTVYHFRSYLMEMRQNGISDSTIGGVREVLCAFFSWLYKERLIETNPCTNLNSIKVAKKIRLPFTSTEIERIKESCKTDRDKAIVCFLLATGCRISEVCELDRDSIDFQSMEVTVHGKGNKERTVYIDSIAAMVLRRYFKARSDLHRALFVGKGSERMTPGGIRFLLKHIEKCSGVDNIHPHRFRRTLATNLINRGMPIQEVAAILGHDKIDTTMRYIYISKTNVKSAYQKYA